MRGVVERDLVTYYRLRAPEYDRLYARPERQQDIGALATSLGTAVVGRRVLELAAGTGYWTPIMAASAECVVATDINPETLAIAEGRDYPRGNVEFRIADAYAPEAVAGDFDCVFAGYFLSHVPRNRVSPFMQSIVNRVGGGGRLLLVDNLYVDDSNLPISRTDAEGDSFQTRQLDNGQSFEVLKNFYDAEELEQLARSYTVSFDVLLLNYYWLLQLDLS